MRGFLRIAPVLVLLHFLLQAVANENVDFQSTCAKNFIASSLAVMTAGISSTFTITATDYPGIPCTLGSEMFGFTLRQYPESYLLSPRSSSQWSVTPPNQFVLPLSITASGIYSTEVVRFGKRCQCWSSCSIIFRSHSTPL